MKNVLLIVFALVSFAAQAQKWGREFGINYVYAQPGGHMGHIIFNGHGAGMNFGFVTPENRLALGLDLNLASYGRDKSRQSYTMDDGTVAPMDIIVSNTFVNMMVYAKWYAFTQGNVRPYLVGKAGYSSFGTNLNIYDPNDFDHCEPVDSDVLHDDGTLITTIGAGAKVDMSTIFKKLQSGMFYFDGSVNLTRGGEVSYMNADAPVHHHGNPPESDEVRARFVNTQTQIVHEHHVGYLYTSPVKMVDVRIGFSISIGR